MQQQFELCDIASEDISLWFSGTWVELVVDGAVLGPYKLNFSGPDGDLSFLPLPGAGDKTVTIEHDELRGVVLRPILFTPRNLNVPTKVGALWVTRPSYSRMYKKSLTADHVRFDVFNAPMADTSWGFARHQDWIKVYLEAGDVYPSPMQARERIYSEDVWACAFSPHFTMCRSLTRRELLLLHKGICVGMFPFSRELGKSMINRVTLVPQARYLVEELSPYVVPEVADEQ